MGAKAPSLPICLCIAPGVRRPLIFGVLLALVVGCAPRLRFDQRKGAIVRSDGAYEMPLTPRDRTRWQPEVPGVGGAPSRYPFDYDLLLYQVRTTRPGLPPRAVVVVTAHPMPESVTRAQSLSDRSVAVHRHIVSRLGIYGLESYADDDDRVFYDGRSVTVVSFDPKVPLSGEGVGAMFIFGGEYLFEALFELFPEGAEDALSVKEIREIMQSITSLLQVVQVK